MSGAAKHTPGPWTRNPGGGMPLVGIELNDGGPMLPIVEIVSGHTEEGALANADLIAAAPELLALAEAFEVTGPDGDGLVWIHIHESNVNGAAAINAGKATGIVARVALLLEESRRAAIAKARGEA